MLDKKRRELYRSIWRYLHKLDFERPTRVNLARLYRPQLRAVFTNQDADWHQLEQQVQTTFTLLSSDRPLVKSLASLSYHNYPYSIPNTRRRLSHLPAPIPWNAKDPQSAKQRFEALKKDAPVLQMSDDAGRTVVETMMMAERTTGAMMGELLPQRSRHLHRR